jgi:hypothetical protein
MDTVALSLPTSSQLGPRAIPLAAHPIKTTLKIKHHFSSKRNWPRLIDPTTKHSLHRQPKNLQYPPIARISKVASRSSKYQGYSLAFFLKNHTLIKLEIYTRPHRPRHRKPVPTMHAHSQPTHPVVSPLPTPSPSAYLSPPCIHASKHPRNNPIHYQSHNISIFQRHFSTKPYWPRTSHRPSAVTFTSHTTRKPPSFNNRSLLEMRLSFRQNTKALYFSSKITPSSNSKSTLDHTAYATKNSL